VAANVAALGAKVTLFGACGPDDAAHRLRGLLDRAAIDAAGLLTVEGRSTGLKTRILAGGQQVVRIDRETVAPLPEDAIATLLDRLEAEGPFAAVVVSDYGKGVVGSALMDRLRAWHAGGQVVVVDPKQGNFELYRGVTAITPNEKEAAGATHERIEDAADAARVGEVLRARLDLDLLLLTRGEHGMCLLEGAEGLHHIPTEARQVFDVTGAGDTVIAVFSALLGAGAEAELAARLANAAAGLAVGRSGTAAIGVDELLVAWTGEGGRA
jgi:D-beta-D-heptose 7-phosphate kinase/D-beta-D-heptose 1-phosphate adenosyltransferase